MKHILNIFLKKIGFALFLISAISSCAIPVNLNYESSKMLEKGDFDVQGNGSLYISPDDQLDMEQVNFGLKCGMGITDKFNLKLRTEGLFSVNGDGFVFIEIDNKLKLSEMTALSLPLGVYTSFDGASLQFDPRFYFTPIQTDKFDLTFIPKCHIYGFDLDEIYPGISIGAGFSSDFNKWVIRPEIGYDRLSLSAGISFTYRLKNEE